MKSDVFVMFRILPLAISQENATEPAGNPIYGPEGTYEPPLEHMAPPGAFPGATGAGAGGATGGAFGG